MNFKSNTSPDSKDKFYKTNNVNFITSYLESKNKKYYEEDLPYDERLRDKVKDNAKYSTRNKNELMNSSPHDDFYLKTSTPFKLNKPEYKNELYRLNMSKHYHQSSVSQNSQYQEIKKDDGETRDPKQPKSFMDILNEAKTQNKIKVNIKHMINKNLNKLDDADRL